MTGDLLPGGARYGEVVAFFLQEAELLDDRRFRDWLELWTDDAVYQIPIRQTREEANASEFASSAWHLNENRHMLEVRVARLETGYAWSESPPSRTRHFVTNVRLAPGDREDEVRVKTNVLVYRNRQDSPQYDLLSAERHDVLLRVAGRWKLARRVVLLDQSTLGTHNLAIFF